MTGVVDPAYSPGRAGGVDHLRRARHRPGVGHRAAGSRVGPARRQQHDRLACRGQGPGRGDERASVDHVLGVDRHRARARVVHAGEHQVDHGEVGLVAHGDEPGDAQPALDEEDGEVEDQVAALAEHGDLPGREHGVAQLQPGAGVGDPDAVRTDQHRTRLAGDGHRLGLGPGALLPELGEAGGDRHDRPRTGGDRLLHGRDERGRRDAQHDQVRRCAEQLTRLGQRRARRAPEHLGAAAVHQRDRTGRARLERAPTQDVAPLRRVGAGADDRDRGWLEEGVQSGPGGAPW